MSKLYSDEKFSLEEIKKMSKEEINVYNDDTNHKCQIRSKDELILLGALPFIFLIRIDRHTQASQRKYLWRSHVVIYSILIAIITLISALI